MAVNVSDWSTTPSSNTSVDGINIAENCPPDNMNNAVRAIMAGVRGLYDTVTSLSTTVSGKLSAAGAVFSGTRPIYTAEGAFINFADTAYTSGKAAVLPDGAADPTDPNTVLVFFYTP